MSAFQVMKQGYLRKLKTMKRKYFVLKSDISENLARLEYYDSEKKWKTQAQPKRVISLKSCFNIQRRLDTKHKHVIALYTKEDCFCVVLDGEEELSSWLNALLTCHGEEGSDDLPHPRQHVWQVNVQKKGLGASSNIVGLYHLCLTDKIVTLVKIRANNTTAIPYDSRASDTMEFSLASIRRCGDSECFFYMELGRSAVTGAGELWMHTEDNHIAQSMHATILNAMSNLSANKEDLCPKTRSRSSSANEASKPVFVLTRRQTHSGVKSYGLSPSSEIDGSCGGRGCVGSCLGQCAVASASYGIPSAADTQASGRKVPSPPTPPCHGVVSAMVRERCDSLPSRHCIQEGAIQANVPPTGVPLRPYSFDINHAVSRSPPFDKPRHGFDGISMESIGSTASVDEVDCLGNEWSAPHLVSKAIPEEDCEMLNSASQIEPSGYMEMSAPSTKPKNILHSTKVSSENHSRTSSLVEDASEGYMPMVRHNTDDGYIEMDKSRNRTASTPGSYPSHLSPAASSCSVTSGTPSTDMRFSEFHLEKVTSYFPPTEEDECGRPTRAYSVGSRPEFVMKGANRPSANVVIGENRARAFSTGSRNRARPPLGTPPRHFVHPLHSFHHLNGFVVQTSAPKSTSAPQLPGANVPSRHAYSSSHGSAEPLDDLMELDFSNRGETTPKVDSPFNNRNSAGRYNANASAGIRSSANKNSQLTLPLPISSSNSSKNNYAPEGYLEMSPGSSNAAGYVEMKPADLSGAVSTPSALPSSGKMIFARSPPSVSASTTPDGYVEMSWKKNDKKLDMNLHTKPITIFANNSRDNDAGFKNSSKLNNASTVENAEDSGITTSPIVSPGASPGTPVNSSMHLKRSAKKHQRRNSKETNSTPGGQSQLIFPFSLNSPGSPLKPFAHNALAETLNRKCSVDASSGTVKLTDDRTPDDELETSDILSGNDYAEMIPGRLSTVREINEPTFNKINLENQKSIKQMLNNATKASRTIRDINEYINIDNCRPPKPTLAANFHERNVGESSAGDYAIMNPSAIRNKPVDGTAVAPKSQNILRKITDPPFASGGDSNAGNQSILSSNPLASKAMMTSSPAPVDDDRKPILVTVAGHLRPAAAEFKPIVRTETHDNRESRSAKSRSPKPVESALNRQLTARRPGDDPRSSCANSEKAVLHYASLDLECTGERSPRPDPPSANSPASSTPAFAYARIDFVKSEELRNANAANANAVGGAEN